jgi:carbamoylphosphate synthase small subunit
LGVELTVVPYDHPINSSEYDGLFISNGPGNPEMAAATVANLKVALNEENPKPIFGICLGNQLMALAAGA